jgi:hypothetical protein
VFGAFGGADVPKIQYKNEPAQELLKLQDAYADDERRAQMTALNAAIQGLGQKKSQDFSMEQQDDQQKFSGEESRKQREYNQGENINNRKHQEDLTRLRADENVRQTKETQQYIPATQNGLEGQKNKVTGQFYPDPYQGSGTDGSGSRSGRGKDKTDKNFYEVYKRGSSNPVAVIKTRDQAINIVNEIIAKNKNNPEFKEYIEQIIGGNAYGINPLGEVSDQSIQLIIDRYWTDDAEHIDESVNLSLKQKQKIEDYKLTVFNQEDRKNLNMFIGSNLNATEGQIYSYLKKYNPSIPEDVAIGIAYDEVNKIQQGQQAKKEALISSLSDPLNRERIEAAAEIAMREYPNDQAKQLNAVKQYLISSMGYTPEQAESILK